MVKVSVVIPVYNVEKYLTEALSVRRQTLEDIEIILVNDGSTDGSLKVCREHAAKDSRITVMDKPNGGVSSARNAGLERCLGGVRRLHRPRRLGRARDVRETARQGPVDRGRSRAYATT